MSNALTIIFQIYDKFVNFVFNQMNIVTNVSVGWVMVGCFIFGVLLKSILALPRSAPTHISNARMDTMNFRQSESKRRIK